MQRTHFLCFFLSQPRESLWKRCQCLSPKVKILLSFMLCGKTNSPNSLCKYIFPQSASHLSVLYSSLNINTSGHFSFSPDSRFPVILRLHSWSTCELLSIDKKKFSTVNIGYINKQTMKNILCITTVLLKSVLQCRWEVSRCDDMDKYAWINLITE